MPTRKRLQDRGYHGLVVSEGVYANMLNLQTVYNTPSMSATVAMLLAELKELRARPEGLTKGYALATLESCGASPELVKKFGKRL